ncbi:uncharacterized protein LOC116431481 [Nomia melanderi]|uniref:uncharacterized protein LOC116431481 n=1 Tax=Nomia melanderi TaxID=2448451 RepID=UPI003FCEBB6A
MYGSPGILLLLCLIAAKPTVQTEPAASPRVVIVGAGASGIAAASRLLQNGIDDVLILEAEGRIGGRVNTVEFDDYVVDLGAQWVHGHEGNVAYDLAAPLNLTDHSDPFVFKLCTSNGAEIDPELTNNITNVFLYYLEQMNDTDLVGCSGSLSSCVEPKLREELAQYPALNETTIEELLWTYNIMVTGLDPADTWDDIAACQGNEEGSGGDRAVNWKNRGYSTILDILMKKLPNPEEELPVLNKTILNAEVTKIDYSSEDGPVKLTTKDGKEYVADHVIMTPSLGVLKAQHEAMFNPQLPESKIKNIKNIGFGNAAKVWLAFDDIWYNERDFKNLVYLLMWSDAYRNELENDPKKKWMPYTASVNIVEHKPRLLLLWISGKGGALMDDLTDEEVLEHSKELLHSFFSKDYNVTDPVAMIRSKWHQNKHFRGTYSYPSVDTAKTQTSARQLGEPVLKMGKPVILFAGEATNPGNYATVHGAIGAGWREADRLISLYSKNK